MRYFFIALLCVLLIGCSNSPTLPGIHVGPYIGSVPSDGNLTGTKALGHKNKDIYNPTKEDIQYYCSMCHLIY